MRQPKYAKLTRTIEFTFPEMWAIMARMPSSNWHDFDYKDCASAACKITRAVGDCLCEVQQLDDAAEEKVTTK